MERWIRSIFSLKIMQQYVWYWHRTAIRLNMKRDSRLKDWMSSKSMTDITASMLEQSSTRMERS
mgnify:FL=1